VKYAVVVLDAKTGTPVVAYGPYDHDQAKRVVEKARDDFSHPIVMELRSFGKKT